MKDLTKFCTISPNHIIGKCISIEDDYIEIEVLDYDSFIEKYKNPLPMLRIIGERIGNDICKIDKIIAVDIKEAKSLSIVK